MCVELESFTQNGSTTVGKVAKCQISLWGRTTTQKSNKIQANEDYLEN